MHRLSITALLVTPVVAGIIPTLSYLLSGSPQQLGANEWIQVAAWVIFALAFEFIVLIPMAMLFKHRKHFRLSLFSASVVIWALLSFTWFLAVFRVSVSEARAPTALMGLAGLVICGTFVALWGRTSSNTQSGGGLV